MPRHRNYALAAFLFLLTCNPAFISAQTTSNFVPITPCRVVDTRSAAGTFGGPSIQAQTSRDFPIPSSSCGIPGGAIGYSLNVAVVPKGPLSYITVWPTGAPQPTAANLNSPSGAIISNAVLVEAGTNGSISIYVSNTTDVVVDITGYFVAYVAPTIPTIPTPGIESGVQNTGIGFSTLAVNTGEQNTAMGAYALNANTSGNNNVALGADALLQNATGSANTAVGGEALNNDLVANDNTAIGFSALWADNVGISNTAVGVSALYTNTAGSYNVALGQEALNGSTGSWNIGLGYQAGNQVTTGSYNILIGNVGQSGDSNTMRIGTALTETGNGPTGISATYIAGIAATTVPNGTEVIVNSSGQLGIPSSSARVKEDIHDIGERSDPLMLLRPVTFRYKQPLEDGTKPLQYGLIGEEVAKIYPELVLYDKDGQVLSLKYQELPSLLLSELQKQHKLIEELQARIAALEAQIAQQPKHK